MPADFDLTANGDATFRPMRPDESTAALEDLIASVLEEQGKDWLSGKRTPACDWLGKYPTLTADPFVAAQLIHHEFTLRLEAKQSPDWDEYLRQFPEYADALRQLLLADQLFDHVSPAIGSNKEFPRRFHNFDLLEEIGRGGMGVVFKARQLRPDRLVALKMIGMGAFATPEQRKRFHAEAQALASLKHPNIVQIYEVGEAEDQPYFAFEHVEGANLAVRLAGKPVSARAGAALIETLARALHYAHAQGIIHRDLKPSNVLLDGVPGTPFERYIPKIADFGIAKRLDAERDTRSQNLQGTPSYMAPEQTEPRFGAVDQRTDVYGLGALLYELLTGRPPFLADTALHTLKLALEAEPIGPRVFNQAVPRDLETICLKCLQKDKYRRYTLAEELAADLRRFLDGAGSRPAGRPARPKLALVPSQARCRRPGNGAPIELGCRDMRDSLPVAKRREARSEAVANFEKTQELVAQLADFSVGMTVGAGAPVVQQRMSLERLQIAERNCEDLLTRNPTNHRLRIALTHVRICLGSICRTHNQLDETFAYFQAAVDLWQSSEGLMNRDFVVRTMLANTYAGQAEIAEIRRDYAGVLRLSQQALTNLQDLADADPKSLAAFEELEKARRHLIEVAELAPPRDTWLSVLERDAVDLGSQIQTGHAPTAALGRLALTCFLLGDLYDRGDSHTRAAKCWHDAYLAYKELIKTTRADLSLKLALATCCARQAVKGQPSDSYYREAVALLKETDKRLASLSDKNPRNPWLLAVICLHSSELLNCHANAGNQKLVQQTFDEKLRPLITRIQDPIGIGHSAVSLPSLVRLAGALRKVGYADAALSVARRTEMLAAQHSASSGGALDRRALMASAFLDLSALFRKLSKPSDALRLGEKARRMFEGLLRDQPENSDHARAVMYSWEQIAKARSDLGEPKLALAAFQEAATTQRRVFEQAPDPRNRFELSRCYDRVAHWGGLAGDRAAVAAALLEREKLWPADSRELTTVADDLRDLAESVAKGHKEVTGDERLEQTRYQTESTRVKRRAEALAHQANAGRDESRSDMSP